ncbi:MAG: anaerobic ribonucleoside-triphosphate reductase activating protein [Candidatus Bathyarchaeia archaeon]
MKFGGFQKTSLIDFPNKISSVLFTLGCNLRCPFCYNGRLIIDPKPPFLSEEDALKILRSRKKYVDAVVITGGEPTLNSDLPDFVQRLKNEGFAVKLDTNGFLPDVLEKCLPSLDYVALDFKTSLEKYRLLGAANTKNLLRTIELLKNGNVDYELRNTVVPLIVTEDDVPKMGETVRGIKRFVFQQFNPSEALDEKFRSLKPYPPEVIKSFGRTMEKYVDEVILRI